MIPVEVVESLLGTEVKDIEIYRPAFVHRSAVQHDGTKESNEVLESIGASVLDLINKRFVRDKYTNLSKMTSKVDKYRFITKCERYFKETDKFYHLSLELGLDKWICIDINLGANHVEEVFRSFVGAIYDDLGLIHAKKFVFGLINNSTICKDIEHIFYEMSQEGEQDIAYIKKLSDVLGLGIVDIQYYKTAFTHSSAVTNGDAKKSYETMEFMGDSVLGCVVSKYLYERYEHLQEGLLTKARTKIVCGNTLSEISRKLGLSNWIIMDEKAMRNGWNNNKSKLEDVFESTVGAIELDLGMEKAKKFILSILGNKALIDIPSLLINDNYKDVLMQECQKMKIDNKDLVYKQLNHVETGKFRVGVIVEGKQWGTGKGSTKKEAEQAAAYFALRRMEEVMGVKMVPSKQPNAMIKNVSRK